MRRLLLGFARLSPFGPIFGKELRVSSRRKRTYVLRTLYLLVLALVILAFYAQSNSRYYSDSVVARSQRNAQMGAEFFTVFSAFSCIAMALIGPILTATAINSERLHKTLPVLLMTPISAWQIASGKLMSRLLVAMTLLGLSLPALAVVRLLGGVEAWQVGAMLLLCLATVIFTAALGLLVSTLASRAQMAIILAYALLMLLWMVVPAGLQLWMRDDPQPMILYLSLAVPPVQVSVISSNLPFPGAEPWYACVVFLTGASTGMLLLTAGLLRRRARREMAGETAVARPQPAGTTAPTPDGAASQPAAHARDRRRADREIDRNPVLWRELRRPMFGRRWQRVAASLIVVGVLLGMYGLIAYNSYPGNSGLRVPHTHMAFAIIFCAAFCTISCILSATAISTEKESDTWTLLLTTPLTAREIVLGKFAGLLKRLFWPAALIAGHFIAFAVLGGVSFLSAGIVLWITGTCNLVWVATGLYLSLRLKSTTFAATLNLLLPIGLYVGSLILLAIADGFTGGRSQLVEAEAYYTPYFYLVQGVELTADTRWTRAGHGPPPGVDWSRPTDPEVWLPIVGTVPTPWFVALCGGVGVVYLAGAWGMLAWTVKRFDRIVGRAPDERPRPGSVLPAPAA